MFAVERFIEECCGAVAGADAAKAALELVTRALSEPGAVAAAFGEREHAGQRVLHCAPNLTIIDFAWAPWMPFKPHNHRMWSVVGIFDGREDNVFWKRTPRGIEAAGARSLGRGEATLLGHDIIHSVVNPLGKMTRAIHVYGGDFFAPAEPRSEWDHETLVERPWDIEHTRRLFLEAEERAKPRGV
jgi:predicted metal-dependent enzyme (double-stranded beta helix superfamily)